jgi:hypothetical protein
MTAFVLGNGVSRRDISVDLMISRGAVYGCNALYRTHRPLVLVATDTAIAEEIQESGYALHNRFYTRRPLPNTGAQIIDATYRGFSSGPVALSIAAQDGNQRMYLLGFDMGPVNSRFNNIYADTPHYKPSQAEPTFTGNWTRQICQICQTFGDRQFVRVHGDTTAAIPEFARIRNLTSMAVSDFVLRLNTGEDL